MTKAKKNLRKKICQFLIILSGLTLWAFHLYYTNFLANLSWPLYDNSKANVAMFGTLQMAIISYYLAGVPHKGKAASIDGHFWAQVALAGISIFFVFQSTVAFFRGPLGIEPINWESKIAQERFEVENSLSDARSKLAYASNPQSKATNDIREDIVYLQVQAERLNRIEQIESRFISDRLVDRSEKGFRVSSQERYSPLMLLASFHLCLLLYRRLRFDEIKFGSSESQSPSPN
ncbi:hypothetical protein [Aquidulcibacter paucihalophilus]|uniref:hypothetical protein n=1 Tax=Aquidulcibacter paucihalophilus TaxID=1978549 RepID=UPI000A19AD42|nr:hypothetical protein [Aquidulcibacter paucihalophilus]